MYVCSAVRPIMALAACLSRVLLRVALMYMFHLFLLMYVENWVVLRPPSCEGMYV